MSKTLFWYMFWQLLRVFLMTSVALAAITSFAGILRPLTENGLGFGQVGQMILYMMPAMCTYSMPVAALFAATVVYGRLSADNELNSMRACGIGYLSPLRFSIALPGLVLGLLVAVISLLMLCFIVPTFMLDVEQVIFSNLATVIAAQIQKNHEFDIKDVGSQKVVNVYAESARALPVAPKTPLIQTVDLVSATLVTYSTPDQDHPAAMIPKNFWMARDALLSIERFDMVGGDVSNGGPNSVPVATLSVALQDGMEFPRLMGGDVEAGVARTNFGPVEIPAPVRESVKFMDVKRLTELVNDPGQSRTVQTTMREITGELQQYAYVKTVADSLDSQKTYAFPMKSESGDTYSISLLSDSHIKVSDDKEDLFVHSTQPGTEPKSIAFEQKGEVPLQVTANTMHMSCLPDIANHRLNVSLVFADAKLFTQQPQPIEQVSFSRSFSIAMPAEIQQLEDLPLAQISVDPDVSHDARNRLRHDQIVISNGVASELHSRASFAISCLALVMMGTALGMMFRSGNFMNAFAVSFIPALLCITMIVCGQSIAQHVPYGAGVTVNNPLILGLWFIWSGNILVIIAAGWLTIRLIRQ